MKKNSLQQTRNLLLIPSIPTPNGRLHLGHIAGPFLKMDAIKRFNRQIGNQAFIYGGIDSHDSYVLLKAYSLSKEPREINNYYYKQISDDLRKMLIDVDYLMNPLASDINNEYISTTQKLTEKFINEQIANYEIEKYPYATNHNYLPPSFISGNCPFCCSSMTGLICEKCGNVCRPEKMLNKHYVTNNIEEKNIYSWFLPINKVKVMENLASKKIPKFASDLIQLYLSNTNEVRLTVPTRWGVKSISDDVYYNYGTFFPYCFFLAEICRRKEKLSSNAFDLHSNIETVGSFGFDNIITFTINTINHAIYTEIHKGFTHYLPNKFMTLNGMKFSTSKNHAIWVEKINKNISIDLIRLYLFKNNADHCEKDFHIDEFIDFYNAFSTRYNKKLFEADIVAGDNHFEAFNDVFYENLECLMPENYSGVDAYQKIERWFSISILTEYWFRGFAIIAYPLMPKISLQIWNAFGETGVPTAEKYFFQALNKEKIFSIKLIDKNDIEVG